MALQVVKQLHYDKAADTILGVPREEFIKTIEEKLRVFLASSEVEKAYTDLPEDISKWFDEDGTVEVKLKAGVPCDYQTVEELNWLLFEISNEDGIVVIIEDDDTWNNCRYFVPEEKAYAGYRRIK